MSALCSTTEALGQPTLTDMCGLIFSQNAYFLSLVSVLIAFGTQGATTIYFSQLWTVTVSPSFSLSQTGDFFSVCGLFTPGYSFILSCACSH